MENALNFSPPQSGVRVNGRRTDDELTVFKSLGLAAEDLAAAEHIFARAQSAGAGVTVPF